MPAGFRVVLDPDTVVVEGGRVLVGGEPRRVLRLSEAGSRAFSELLGGPVRTPAAGALARRLVSAGAAHPRPPLRPGAGTGAQSARLGGRVAVIVPVHDRADQLDALLGAMRVDLGTGTVAEIIVVDDGSTRPAEIAGVVARHGARLVPRAVNAGPAAARNSGLAAAGDADLIAFIDSDCVPPAGWLERLAAHFDDPAVGGVAPRVSGLARRGLRRPLLDRYAAVRSPLDLGTREALVRPGTRVPYVPTAALVVRREALGTPAFDGELRYGEDVDAVWRMIDAGWQVRYQPDVVVGHAEPGDWPAYLRRRFRYGTSAGPLARRHPDRLAPLVLQPWPTAIAALVLARRPGLAAGAAAMATAPLARTLRDSGVPAAHAPRMTAQAVGSTLTGLARATAQFGLPVVVPAAVLGGARRARSRRGRRLALLSVLLASPWIREWVSRRPDVDLPRWIMAGVVDDIAYGAGVWAGALRARTGAPLIPHVGRMGARKANRGTGPCSAARP